MKRVFQAMFTSFAFFTLVLLSVSQAQAQQQNYWDASPFLVDRIVTNSDPTFTDTNYAVDFNFAQVDVGVTDKNGAHVTLDISPLA